MVQVQHRRDLSSVDDHSNLSSMVPWISSITSTVHKAGGREEAAAALNGGGARTRRQALKARAPACGGQRRRTCSGPQPDVKRALNAFEASRSPSMAAETVLEET